MNQWWALLILAGLISTGVIGYKFGDDSATATYEKTIDNNQQAQIKDKADRDAKAQKIAQGYEAQISALQKTINTKSEEWNNDRLKTRMADCALPSAALKLLNGSARIEKPAASGLDAIM